MKPPKSSPPRGLKPATRRWFVDVTERWELEDHHVKILAVAARSWDEAETATVIVRRDGLLVTMPSGARRPNPAVRIANEARAVFMRALRELDLDIDAPAEAKRPPALRSIAGRRGA